GEEGLCVLPLPCEDNIQNGSETDIDCGGDECGGCDTGETCLLGSDCLSKVCDSLNQCAEPSCFDTVKNGDETDINCGGSVCDPCVEGEKCLSGSDCESNICDDLNVCSGSSCIDSVRNADETDIDCGGPLCSPCIAGKHCTMGSDCLSLICDITDICTAPSCDDLVQNGDEIDTDCGGSQCPACGAGLTCFVNSDCSSGYCNGGICENTTSCKALFAVDPLMLPGDYVIETLTGPVWVYCHLDGVTAYTFHYVDGGVPTNHKDVNNSCKLAGLMLFTPTSQAHYAMGRDYLLSIGGQTGGNFLGPLGIYNPSDGDDSGWDQWCEHDSYCCRKKMIGGGAADTVSVGSCGFTSLAGQSFWASEITTLTEPNGDYDANCWLGFRYNANGDVASWNDDDCTYSYSSYLCMATDDF
ncbi:hypothetical protein KJ865_12905, partial [Myxococcota bacterium]|nr:hypothetical protein [Myxococcota bacterium]